MDERPVTEPGGQNVDSGAEQPGQDGKALRKTFEEIREDARREVLSSADREKFDGLEPDERVDVGRAVGADAAFLERLPELDEELVDEREHLRDRDRLGGCARV